MTIQRNFFSNEEIEEFKNDGFLIVRELFSATEMEEMSEEANALANRPPEVERQAVYFEDSVTESGKRIISRIEDFGDHYPYWKSMLYDHRIMKRLESLFGEPAFLFRFITFKCGNSEKRLGF
jgi:2-aminoethylphosphonate dioxygenase